MPRSIPAQHKLQAEPQEFETAYETAANGVRSSLTSLLLSVGADASKPQEVARRFGLNKNLTWMISKIITTSNIHSVAHHLPGSNRLDSVLRAMGESGAPADAVQRVRDAFDAFDRMVEVHAKDRATLELLTAGMASSRIRAEQLLQCRKQAYLGNSGMLGVRAAHQLSCFIAAPNAEKPTLTDLIQIGGFTGFHRLRPDVRWLLFRRQRWNEDASDVEAEEEISLETGEPVGDSLPLMREFCSTPLPNLAVEHRGDEVHHELMPGTVGCSGAMSLFYGSLMPRVGAARRDERNRHAEFGRTATMPTERLSMDLLIHDDLGWTGAPEIRVCSRVDSDPVHLVTTLERTQLPVTEPVLSLGRGVDALATPHIPLYTDLVRHAFDVAGWDPSRFRAYRFAMEYPPTPALAILRLGLPE